MRLSRLQKHIMLICRNNPSGRSSRQAFYGFYKTSERQPKHNYQVKIITKTIERLIDRELLIGYGVRTPHKWYIKEIKLTPKGRKEVKKLLGEQQSLPLDKVK